MAEIELRNIAKSYGDVEVLRDVNLTFDDGEFVVLVGPSGCGKSTLLRMIAGLESITGGEIAIGGAVVNDRPPRDRDIAMVFQSYALYPHMNVARNMGFSLEIRKEDKALIRERVALAARTLGLSDLLERLPKELSGGQRQRVAMGRAIVRDPEAFLFDEPLSNLDAALRVEMRIEIARLHQELQATMVYVTHDQVEALTLADRIVVMNRGRIEQVGTPLELYESPANLFVATFIGSPKMNVVDCTADERGVHLPGGGIFCPEAWSPDFRPARLGVRPEHIDLTAGGQGDCCGWAEVVERLGSDTFVYVNVDDWGGMVARQSGNAPINPGDRVGLHFDPAQARLFDNAGTALYASETNRA
ncbi:sn-glycerol-3-phosphate ABC transporter ATP-binding protein UgpC [Pelagibius litoralis]|uniref:Sn-glycerol-3-phosphate ABC transporter ATP-binding protein UgpC n=1 Tax=Pelagibius litoralis TaxID=374515 RepID=A0A967KCQ8_9PROT|nr:sn-glycerol-3-phosphate ABC transporter ATP-binding protein UgpC [Pelagibius litoralis]NIA69810.1 sn-glycerol-3-phosphate ABC transporter ATP-binding protein UgpC [Pelagibius litoralis]